jgi:hypothetical protein
VSWSGEIFGSVGTVLDSIRIRTHNPVEKYILAWTWYRCRIWTLLIVLVSLLSGWNSII